MNPPYDISVVIPVKNGDAWLDRTLPAILGQKIPGSFEVIVIDSGSTDNTLALLKKYPVRVHHLPAEEFNHGTTRNLGVSLARGRYVAMTVQDAEPADEHWLGRLLAGFDDDRVAAVCGQQIVPHDPDKNPVAWFRPVDPPGIKRVSFPDAAAFEALPAAEKRALCSWDNVNALYRRDILERIPFRKTDFAEDALWAADALRAGYHLVYNTAARVRHYHFETPDLAFRRSFTEMYHEYKFFGLTPAPPKDGWTALLRTIRLLLKARTIGWGAKWKWLVYNRQQRKAVGRAVQAFTTALEKGEEQLDILHRQICKKPPQALKPAAMQATYEQQR